MMNKDIVIFILDLSIFSIPVSWILYKKCYYEHYC